MMVLFNNEWYIAPCLPYRNTTAFSIAGSPQRLWTTSMFEDFQCKASLDSENKMCEVGEIFLKHLFYIPGISLARKKRVILLEGEKHIVRKQPPHS